MFCFVRNSPCLFLMFLVQLLTSPSTLKSVLVVTAHQGPLARLQSQSVMNMWITLSRSLNPSGTLLANLKYGPENLWNVSEVP